MRQDSKTLFVTLFVLIALAFALSAPDVQARPQYLKQFTVTYPNLANDAKMKKCLICHPGQNKKMNTDYGKAVAEGLGKDEDDNPIKNEKNTMKIEQALKKAEEAKSKNGKTFGEMIENGELPE